MSLPVSQIECLSCRDSWSTMVAWGCFEYQTAPGQLVSVDRTVGWCHNCAAFQAIERIPDLAELARKVEDKKSSLIETEVQEREKLTYHGIRGFIRKVLWGREHLQCMIERLGYARRALVDAEREFNWRSNRTAPPHCLQCGSKRVENVDLGSRTDAIYATEFRHPKCGGMIAVKTSGMRIAMDFVMCRFYDTEGRYVRTGKLSN